MRAILSALLWLVGPALGLASWAWVLLRKRRNIDTELLCWLVVFIVFLLTVLICCWVDLTFHHHPIPHETE